MNKTDPEEISSLTEQAPTPYPQKIKQRLH
jgi:hypothetical protein